MSKVKVLHGDCIELMRAMPDASVDSIVTDPPYELGFMGKKWDAAGIAYSTELWAEALRVLKPGGHLLAFGGTRTYHRMACAIEDAGFEIRDSIHWIYGSGFPKSLDVSKAIDKTAGAEREVVGTKQCGYQVSISKARVAQGHRPNETAATSVVEITAPATTEAKRWEGWGTALKPAHEPIVVARKPLSGTVAANVLEHGTGALNIDGCRVGTTVETWPATRNYSAREMSRPGSTASPDAETQPTGPVPPGRWPANIVLDGAAAAALDQQQEGADRYFTQADFGPDDWPFVYQAKPSKRERNAGLDGLPEVSAGEATGGRKEGSDGLNSPAAGAGRTGGSRNHHPTVKPVALMRHLVRLVTPPGGVVLDPFAGSGTTLVAAVQEGFDAIGCEMTDEYLPIIKGRVAWAKKQAKKKDSQLKLEESE